MPLMPDPWATPVHLLFLCFLFYSFIGWIIDTLYIRVHNHKWTKRGFLHGPVCPIYGFGAMLLLFFLAPLRQTPVLFYIGAVLLTSALEYSVGWLLEATTKLKYWDYSDLPCNLQGRICLWISLCWGMLAAFLQYWLHPWTLSLFTKVPADVRRVVAIVLLVLLSLDTAATVSQMTAFTRFFRRLEDSRMQIMLLRSRLRALPEGLNAEDMTAKLKSMIAAHSKLEKKVELLTRRFRKAYANMSSFRYAITLEGVKEAGQRRLEQLAQRQMEKTQARRAAKAAKVAAKRKNRK